jgi:prevent-host-death family protein
MKRRAVGVVRAVRSTGRSASGLRTVQTSKAKIHLPQLLREVERGEALIITRHGREIARIVPELDKKAFWPRMDTNGHEWGKGYGPRMNAD